MLSASKTLLANLTTKSFSLLFRFKYLILFAVTASTILVVATEKPKEKERNVIPKQLAKTKKPAFSITKPRHNHEHEDNHEHANQPLQHRAAATPIFSPPEYSCPNITNGVFDQNWRGYTGICCPEDSNDPMDITVGPAIVPGRHTIITDTTPDPNTCNIVSPVFPGSDYSIRLGNDNIGAEAESLTYNLTVDPANPLFIYRYAVVLEDPRHNRIHQPRFELRILDTSGNLVDPICGYYKVVSSGNIDGFQFCAPSVRFKDWSSVGIDLTPYAGQDLTVEFSTGDCFWGGHYGYAYFEPLSCSSSGLQISNYCPETSNTLDLSAPDGFEYLWNTGETTRSITVTNANPGDSFSCTLRSAVHETCEVTLQYTIPAFDTGSISFTGGTDNCSGISSFDASGSVLPADGIITEFVWDFGDGTTVSSGIDPTVEHNYQTSGNYIITLIVKSGTCEFSRTINLDVNLTSQPGVIGQSMVICSGETPDTITELQPAQSSYPFTYQWQTSLDGTNFTNIAGETNESFSPPPSVDDISYRRAAIFIVNGDICPKYSNIVSVFYNNFLVQGSIASDQLVCTVAEVNPIEVVTNTVVTGVLTHQWQVSVDNITFTDISGANQPILTPTIANNNSYFRRVDHSDFMGVRCTYITNVVNILINDVQPGNIAGATTICNNEVSPTITQATPATNAALAELRYQWQILDTTGVFVDISGATQEEYSPRNLSETSTYQRTAISTLNGLVCSQVSNPVTVTVLEPLVLSGLELDEALCSDFETLPIGATVSIPEGAVQGGGEVYTYSFFWDANTPNDTADDELLQTGAQTSYIESSTETRSIRVVVQDNYDCTAESNILIPGVTPLEAETIVQQELCLGDVNGRIDVAISGGTPPYATSLNNENNYIEDQIVFDGLTGGQEFIVYVRDARNCKVMLPVTLTPSVDLASDISIEYFCNQESLVFENIVTVTVFDDSILGGITYTLDNDLQTAQSSPVFNNISPGSHTLDIAYTNGCIREDIPFEIEGTSSLYAIVDTHEQNFVTIEGIGGVWPYEYKIGDSPYGDKNRFVIYNSGEYAIYIRDAMGCVYTTVVTLEFVPIYVPNFFTPDGDGVNDFWKPANLTQFPNALVLVYDRYGREVALLDYVQEWDGLYQNSEMPSGDYWYVVDTRDPNSTDPPTMGHFTLYR